MERRQMWSESQIHRLSIEKELLETHFPGRTSWHDHIDANRTKIEIALNTNDDIEYVLRVYLTDDFPNSCPTMTVVSPRLRLRNGDSFPQTNTEFHTLQNVDGYPSICHFHPAFWTQENTLYQVFMKGRVWLEAYSLYHITGEVMDKYLKEFENPPPPVVASSDKKKLKKRLSDVLRRR